MPSFLPFLSWAAEHIPADFAANPGEGLTQAYIIANSVNGLDAGSYVHEPNLKALKQLKTGEFRQEAGYLGLQQETAR